MVEAVFRRAYRARGILVAPVIIAAGIAAWNVHPRLFDRVIGWSLFLLGWDGRMWAQRHLGYRLRQRMRLTTCGPYRLVRNPIYIANTLVVTGTTAMTGSHGLAAGAALLCATVYGLTVRHEEACLAESYGVRYRVYRLTAPRWIPLVRTRSHASGCRCTRTWTDVALAEWHVPLILVPVLLPLVLR